MGGAVYPGGRKYAWPILSVYWLVCAAVGVVGYWELLFETAKSQPALHAEAGRLGIYGALAAIAFLRAAFYMGSFRMKRPLSLFSLVVYPIFNGVLEGFVMLFFFDAGRWLLAEKSWNVEVGSIGFAAMEQADLTPRRMFREFLMGLAPSVIGFITLYSTLWEDHVLPAHLDLGTTNKFVKAMVLANMAMLVVYWLYGDVAMFVALRVLSELLLVLALRLPPPGAELAPALHPEDLKQDASAEASANEDQRSTGRRRRKKDE